jgi:hypothetical protein
MARILAGVDLRTIAVEQLAPELYELSELVKAQRRRDDLELGARQVCVFARRWHRG